MASITSIQHSHAFLPNDQKVESTTLSDKTKRAARIAFFEISLAFAVNVGVMTFFAVPLTIGIMTNVLAGSIIGGIISTAIQIYRQRNCQNHAFSCTQTIARASLANTVSLAGPNIAIHEAGHAVTALSCFSGAKPEIVIHPFAGGSTSYYISELTKFGSFLGKHRSLLLIAGAGMMASTVFAMFEFAAAHSVKDLYPTISEYMNDHAIFQILNEVVYGITAFFANKADLNHDFVKLWQIGGIHPLIPIALIIALPLTEIFLLRFLERKKTAEKVNQAAIANLA